MNPSSVFWIVSVLAGALSFIPGGLGSTEAVMGVLLLLVGVDTATAVAGLEMRLKRDKAGRL